MNAIYSVLETDCDVEASLSEYKKFMVRDLDPKTLKRFQRQAKRERLPVQEVMRQALCVHWEIDCIPSRYAPRNEQGSRNKSMRLQPELHQAIKDESAETGVSMQALVREALEAHYAVA